MSDQDLKTLFHDVQKVGGRLVVRGLHQNSWRVTAEKLIPLKISVDIDPEAFEHYHVTAVPQFVLQGVLNTSVSDTSYDTLKGNVSLGFALKRFSQEGRLKEEALTLLKRLEVS
jgi:conjugal transfer pilus assembly protein TrbC